MIEWLRFGSAAIQFTERRDDERASARVATELVAAQPLRGEGKIQDSVDRCRFLELASPRMMQELVTL
jgi:hypothetical protein